MEQRELHPNGSPRIKSAAEQQDGRTESHQIESDAGKERKTSGKRQNWEWKGLIRDGNENENPLPQSSIPDNINLEDEPHQRVGRRKRSLSPRPTVEKTRRRHEQRLSGKVISFISDMLSSHSILSYWTTISRRKNKFVSCLGFSVVNFYVACVLPFTIFVGSLSILGQ